MDQREWLADLFERHRAHLRAVAYRMLGSSSEADDAVQECWLRLDRSDADQIQNIRSWLTTVVGRVCLDMLRSRRSRREVHAGVSLPDTIITIDRDSADHPEHEADLADSVGLALLIVLDSLTPAERLAFVLHDMFGVSFEEIAQSLDRTPVAVRQLASRARRRVRNGPPPADADLQLQRKVADAFLAAARNGDFDALVSVLHPDVVFRVDTGTRLAPRPDITGAAAVAKELLARGATFAPHARPAIVNGGAGAIVVINDQIVSAVSFAVTDGRIAAIDLVLDPDRLIRARRNR